VLNILAHWRIRSRDRKCGGCIHWSDRLQRTSNEQAWLVANRYWWKRGKTFAQM